MFQAETSTERSRNVISLIEAETDQYGREDSFKLSKSRLRTQRFLVGIPSHRLAPDRVMLLCDTLAMPSRLRALFAEHLAEANMVGVGLEETRDGGVYKIYLEFWDRVKQRVRQTGRPDPLLLHLGFKWHAHDKAGEGGIARYICYPLLSLHDILARIAQTYADVSTPHAQRVTRDLIRHAANANPGAPFLYSEAHEEGNPRTAFDINVYNSNLTVRDAEPFLRDLGRHYQLRDEDYLPLLARIQSCPLGHISGGLDSNGQETTAIYYETRYCDS